MTKVFLGGSRQASRLEPEVRRRLDKIVDKGFPIVIGDANGADRALQQYLHDKGHTKVEVFCSEGECRNNVGGWPIRSVPAGRRRRDAQFYSAKDRAMAQEATVGLMVWDGRSVGTLLNVLRLLRLGKSAVVYVPEKTFVEFRDLAEWKRFLADQAPELRRQVEGRTKLETPSASIPLQPTLLE